MHKNVLESSENVPKIFMSQVWGTVGVRSTRPSQGKPLPVCRDFTEFPELTSVESDRRATLMDSIRQAGGVGRYRLRTAAESEAIRRQRETSHAATAATSRAPRGRAPAGRGDLMRDLSAQLQLRGRAAPIRTVKR